MANLHPMMVHAVELRKQIHQERMGNGLKKKVALVNDWMVTHLAIVFGLAWTIWLFIICPLIAPVLGGTIEAKFFFYSSGWIQLFALPLLVYTGNKVQRSSDAQSEAMVQSLSHIANQQDKQDELLQQLQVQLTSPPPGSPPAS
jgi:hypothetical protein